MNLATVQFASAALQRPATYIALLPDAGVVGPGPYPVLVQLHGYYDDYRSWLTKSNLLQHAKTYPIMIILPDTANGWWANLGAPNQFEDLIVNDLKAHVHSTFQVRPGRWAIGGLSMGGFGALRLGLKHADMFCSIYAHSSAIPKPGLARGFPFVWDDPDRSAAQRRRLRQDLSCYHWADQVDSTLMPRLSFDCGTEDVLLDENRRFHEYLDKIGLPHSYAEYPGGHHWEYWDTHVRQALAQHAEVFGVRQAQDLIG
ncbi:MAG TPA: alpha/beta hydrolase-fold protein [Roseiflexaceae bacterium]|nr:alpha/beta hydrolase-fold protein [Roseiflexaceae bacterium]